MLTRSGEMMARCPVRLSMTATIPSSRMPAFNHYCFFFSSRRRHTRCGRDWSSDVCSSDLRLQPGALARARAGRLRRAGDAAVGVPDRERAGDGGAGGQRATARGRGGRGGGGPGGVGAGAAAARVLGGGRGGGGVRRGGAGGGGGAAVGDDRRGGVDRGVVGGE